MVYDGIVEPKASSRASLFGKDSPQILGKVAFIDDNTGDESMLHSFVSRG